MNGWRIDMEDKVLVEYDASADFGVFGVFDGHGDGGHASDYVAKNLRGRLMARPEWTSAYRSRDPGLLASLIASACYDLDEGLRGDASRPTRDGGTTAIIALVCDRHLIVANVGDSRCILVRKKKREEEGGGGGGTGMKKEAAADGGGGGPRPRLDVSAIEVVPMSEDHKPDLPGERARIESAGLTVQTDVVRPSDGDDTRGDSGESAAAAATTVVHRVRKSDTNLLGVSRAFGDYDYKSNAELPPSGQAVVCTPDIAVRERADDEDMYLILACDGIWDVMSNDDVGEFVARRVEERRDSGDDDDDDEFPRGEVLARVGDELLTACLKAGSRDNMSVLIVAFPASGLASTPLSNTSFSESTALKRENATDIVVVDDVTRALAYE
jgi:serine/threonine protein phosphatase PrpC